MIFSPSAAVADAEPKISHPIWAAAVGAAALAENSLARDVEGAALTSPPHIGSLPAKSRVATQNSAPLDHIPWYKVYLVLSLKESSRMALTIGQVADAADVNIQTIRYYERRGLFPTPRRSPAGYRQYADDAVARLRFIKHAQELGFSLQEIQELLA